MANTHTNTTTSKDHTAAEQTRTDKLRNVVSHAQDSVNDAADNVRNTAAHAVEKGSDHAQNVQSEFDTAVRRNPTFAVLGALGIGVVLGVALNKRA
ncbi:hypothetical protein [Marivita sp.]|uniref:hypothetical protein n=1 Tax=Marivita sp. TaxID=2003365 RepID=UPI003F6B9695